MASKDFKAWSYLWSKTNGLVLQVVLSRKRKKVKLGTKEWEKNQNQLWRLTEDGFVECAAHPNHVLDIKGSTKKPGSDIILVPKKEGSSSQKWEITPEGRLRSTGASTVLDVKSGRAVSQAPNQSGDYQMFEWLRNPVMICHQQTGLALSVKTTLMVSPPLELRNHFQRWFPTSDFRIVSDTDGLVLSVKSTNAGIQVLVEPTTAPTTVNQRWNLPPVEEPHGIIKSFLNGFALCPSSNVSGAQVKLMPPQKEDLSQLWTIVPVQPPRRESSASSSQEKFPPISRSTSSSSASSYSSLSPTSTPTRTPPGIPRNTSTSSTSSISPNRSPGTTSTASTPSSGKEEVKEESEVLAWLQSLSLDSLYDKLKELGATDLDTLLFLEPEDITLPPLQKRRLFGEIDKLKVERNFPGKEEIEESPPHEEEDYGDSDSPE